MCLNIDFFVEGEVGMVGCKILETLIVVDVIVEAFEFVEYEIKCFVEYVVDSVKFGGKFVLI